MNREAQIYEKHIGSIHSKDAPDIIMAMQELARERAIGAIKFTRNLEYMDGTKPQHEFTDEEIYSKYEEHLSNEKYKKHCTHDIYFRSAHGLCADCPCKSLEEAEKSHKKHLSQLK
jgi:hypothetical protein